MRTISKSKLKAHMLEVFRELERTGQELIVTNNNKPVLKIQPITPKKTASEIFGDFQGKVDYYEDILRPTTDEWSEV